MKLHKNQIIKLSEKHQNGQGMLKRGQWVKILEADPNYNYYTIQGLKSGLIIKGCIFSTCQAIKE